MKVSEQIDEFIRVEGKGNVRDALNVALARIDLLRAQKEHAREINEGLAPYIEQNFALLKNVEKLRETLELSQDIHGWTIETDYPDGYSEALEKISATLAETKLTEDQQFQVDYAHAQEVAETGALVRLLSIAVQFAPAGHDWVKEARAAIARHGSGPQNYGMMMRYKLSDALNKGGWVIESPTPDGPERPTVEIREDELGRIVEARELHTSKDVYAAARLGFDVAVELMTSASGVKPSTKPTRQ